MERAIEDIVRTYLRRETQIGNIPTSQHQLRNKPTNISTHLPPEKPLDSEQAQLEQEFVQALYQCLEEKGVMKEVQAFIRQRLVVILKGAWPSLVQTKCNVEAHHALNLIQDFLCTHKLLFTFSVFTTELVDDKFKFRDDFGKMKAEEAEDLLAAIHIPKDSDQSIKILKYYFEKSNWSLLECIIYTSTWQLQHGKPKRTKSLNDEDTSEKNAGNLLTLEEKLKRIDNKYESSLLKSNKNDAYSIPASITDKRIQLMLKELEKEKDIQINSRIERFKKEELTKLREEIETKLKFEFLQKEKQLLSNYEEKVTHITNSFKREKELWFMEKLRQEQDFRRNGLNNSTLGPINDSKKSETAGYFSKTKNHHKIFDDDEFDDDVCSDPYCCSNDLLENFTLSPDEYYSFKSTGFRRKLERNYLFKEASLRNEIDKLKLENKKLRAESPRRKAKRHDSNTRPNMVEDQKSPTSSNKINETSSFVFRDQDMTRNQPEESAGDARAFLQYTVESQAEQIEKLQQAINEINKTGKHSAIEPNTSNTNNDQNETTHNNSYIDVNLEQFLRESRMRCSEIERDTRFVKEKMNHLQIFSRKLKEDDDNILNRIPKPPKLPLNLRTPLRSQSQPIPNVVKQNKVQFSLPSFLENSSNGGRQPLDTSTDSSSRTVDNQGNIDLKSPQCGSQNVESANFQVQRQLQPHDSLNEAQQTLKPKATASQTVTSRNGVSATSKTSTLIHEPQQASGSDSNDKHSRLQSKLNSDIVLRDHADKVGRQVSEPVDNLEKPTFTEASDGATVANKTIVDPKKAFTTGAVIRDKIPSSSGEYSNVSTNVTSARNGKSKDGRSIKTRSDNNGPSSSANAKTKIQPESSNNNQPSPINKDIQKAMENPIKTSGGSATPTEKDESIKNSSTITGPGIVPVRSFLNEPIRSQSLALSLIDDILEMETGKGSSDEDDNLW